MVQPNLKDDVQVTYLIFLKLKSKPHVLDPNAICEWLDISPKNTLQPDHNDKVFPTE